MTKVFLVVERRAHDGDTVMRVFGAYKDAVAYADELTADQDGKMEILYDVFEREVY
jgi:hypothetical protein